MKVYIVQQDDRGYGQTIEGVYLTKEIALKHHHYCLASGHYWLDEEEVINNYDGAEL